MIPDLLFDTCLKLKFASIYVCRPCLEKRKEEEVGDREQENRGRRKESNRQSSSMHFWNFLILKLNIQNYKGW